MKQLLSIGLLGALFTTSNQLEAKNYKVENIGPKVQKMTINMGDSFSYETRAVAPYAGQILEVEVDPKYFSKSTEKPPRERAAGGATTYKFTAKKPTKKSITMTIKRRPDSEQKITVIIQKK